MGKLKFWKTNLGNHSAEKDICKDYENFNGCTIKKTDSKVEIYRGQSLVLNLSITKLEEDSLTITYISQGIRGQKIRVCFINPRLATMLGDSISFASQFKDGFAVHYNIE